MTQQVHRALNQKIYSTTQERRWNLLRNVLYDVSNVSLPKFLFQVQTCPNEDLLWAGSEDEHLSHFHHVNAPVD
jgi:hypothetical protein